MTFPRARLDRKAERFRKNWNRIIHQGTLHIPRASQCWRLHYHYQVHQPKQVKGGKFQPLVLADATQVWNDVALILRFQRRESRWRRGLSRVVGGPWNICDCWGSLRACWRTWHCCFSFASWGAAYYESMWSVTYTFPIIAVLTSISWKCA